MKKFAIILLMSMNLHAQLDFLPLKADYATFISGNDKTYTEVYVSFYQSDLAYQIEDTLKVAHFSHTITISKNDSILQRTERNYKNTERAGVSTQSLRQFKDVFAFEFEYRKFLRKQIFFQRDTYPLKFRHTHSPDNKVTLLYYLKSPENGLGPAAAANL